MKGIQATGSFEGGKRQRWAGAADKVKHTARANEYNAAGTYGAVIAPSQEAIRQAIESQVCPWCGAGPFKMLPVHTNKAHAIDKWELRDLAGLSSQDALCAPEARAAMSAAYDKERGAAIRAARASTVYRKPRRTRAGLERNKESLRAWEEANPEKAQAQRVANARAQRKG